MPSAAKAGEVLWPGWHDCKSCPSRVVESKNELKRLKVGQVTAAFLSPFRGSRRSLGVGIGLGLGRRLRDLADVDRMRAMD